MKQIWYQKKYEENMVLEDHTEGGWGRKWDQNTIMQAKGDYRVFTVKLQVWL